MPLHHLKPLLLLRQAGNYEAQDAVAAWFRVQRFGLTQKGPSLEWISGLGLTALGLTALPVTALASNIAS